MIKNDWLKSYQKPEVVQRVLQRLEERLKNKIPLAAGFPQLEQWRAGLENDFAVFMQEAQQMIIEWKQLN